MIMASAKNEHDPKVYKEKGNECMQNEKYIEAVLHYTFAIKLDLRNAELYSNRSLAFLRSTQHYYALQDAEQVIKLRPKWPKGYFRKAEVLYAAEHYQIALEEYQKALQLQPDDTALLTYVMKTKRSIRAVETRDAQLPWLGSACGIVVGIFVVILEYFMLDNKLLRNPFLQVFVIIVISAVGYKIAWLYKQQMKTYRASLLEKPIDLFAGNDYDADKKEN